MRLAEKKILKIVQKNLVYMFKISIEETYQL